MIKQTELLFQHQSEKGLIEIYQNNDHRILKLNGIEQSRLDTSSPNKLASDLDFYFLASLLFNDSPQNVLLAGLGGGSIASFLHHKKPEMTGYAIEINPLISDITKKYFQFPTNNWSIETVDIKNYQFNNHSQDIDLVFLDIGEKDLSPDWLTSRKMLSQLKNVLNEQGVLIINLLVDNADEFNHKVTTIRQTFNAQTLCASIPQHKNIVVYAFNNRPVYHSKQKLLVKVKSVQKDWGLDYSALLDQLLRENTEGCGVF